MRELSEERRIGFIKPNALHYLVRRTAMMLSIVMAVASCASTLPSRSNSSSEIPQSISYLTYYECEVGNNEWEPAYLHWLFETPSDDELKSNEQRRFLEYLKPTSRIELSDIELENLCRYLQEKGFFAMPSVGLEECRNAIRNREQINAIIVWSGASPRVAIKQRIAGGVSRRITGAKMLRKSDLRTSTGGGAAQAQVERFEEIERVLLDVHTIKARPETRVRLSNRNSRELLDHFRKHMAQWRVRVFFEDPRNLMANNSVLLGNSMIGVVEEIKPCDRGVIATLLLEEKFTIYEDYEFRILQDMETQHWYVWMFPGSPSKAPVDTNTIMKGSH